MALTDFKPTDPIGVLDSGVGGISVLKELLRILPNENYVFYGDSANAPYGTKSSDQIRRLTFHSAEILMNQYHAKAVVVACNTATSAAIGSLRDAYPDRIMVGIEPALKPAALHYEGIRGRVLVLATPTTLKNDKFLLKMLEYESKVEVVPVPCEGLMEFVEAGVLNGPALETYLSERISPFLPAEAIVLGCTHYPFVRDAIRKAAGSDIKLYDGGEGTAKEAARRLKAAGLLNPADEKGSVLFLNSKEEPEQTIALCRRLLES